MNLEEINEQIKEILPPKRVKHSLSVANCAAKLSRIYQCNEEKAYLAGLVHDCAKYLTKEEVNDYVDKYEIYLDELENANIALSHSVIGGFIAKYEFGIEDDDIINAVKYHTTGKEDMNILEKIIYMADLIEEGRNFPDVDILRKLTYDGKIDEALLMSFNNTIKYVMENNQLIHYRTIRARNYILKELVLSKK